ncbi:MAG: hypothetical protein KIT72_06055 [Polyangiaceae bacterium]|nr:hypothetical protein [Polyangiaceae bacterium]MCW5789964.1 hypothetical protein [Polyangiaceae bacterium]
MARPSHPIASGGRSRAARSFAPAPKPRSRSRTTRFFARLALFLLTWVTAWGLFTAAPALVGSGVAQASPTPIHVDEPGRTVRELAEQRVAMRNATRKVPPGFTSYPGGWFTIAYPLAMRAKVQPLIAEADRFREVLRDTLGQPVLEEESIGPRVWVIVARTPGEMASFAPQGYPPPSYASGVAYSQIGLVLLTIDPVSPGAAHSLEEVFRHELAHVAMYDASGRVPTWFNEGFAVHISGESSLTRLQTLWTATVAGRLMPLAKLTDGFPTDPAEADVAYAQSADVVRYLLRDQDKERFHSLIARMRDKRGEDGQWVRGQSFEEALTDAYGKGTKSLEYEWQDDAQKRFTFWPVAFSGSFVWVGALVLLGAAWRKRRRHQREVMARWEREEAAEAEARALASSGLRVHLVVPNTEVIPFHELVGTDPVGGADLEDLEDLDLSEVGSPSERGVPKVRHEGSWHTLH